MQIEWGTIIGVGGVLVAVSGFIISYFTFHGNRDKDLISDARDNAKISAKLDHISGAVDSMRIDSRATDKHIATMNERVIRVEESTKSAHKRIDTLEEEIKK